VITVLLPSPDQRSIVEVLVAILEDA